LRNCAQSSTHDGLLVFFRALQGLCGIAELERAHIMTFQRHLSDTEFEHLLRRSALLEDAREPAVERAIGIWRPRPVMVGDGSAIGRVLAVLRFDSGIAGSLAQGVRNAGARTRQILYLAGGRDVDIRVTQVGSDEACRYDVSGQVFGIDTQGTVQLSGPNYLATQCWSALAEFRFEGVPTGRFTITLQTVGTEIELPPFDLADFG
jgi:hypothetical protein